MEITRREWLGAGAAAAGASVFETARAAPTEPPGRPEAAAPSDGRFLVRTPGAGHDYSEALDLLRAYAIQELEAIGLPGMTLAATDEDGFSAVLALGWADVDRRVPLAPGHYFQIGSISKSFIALTVLALADLGRIDLDAPIASYLPLAALPAQPISVAQLLSHTAGLPDSAPLFPRTPDGLLWCGFPPGSRFSYSNTGYVLLGRIVERVSGMQFDHAVDVYVRRKLGLQDIAGTLSQARRPDFAVGYWPWDRTAAASLPGSRLEFASWNEEDSPAGSIGANSDEMAVYLRALLRVSRGQGAPIFSDAAARRFATPVIAADDFGAGARYACGVAIAPVDGAPCLHHTGGMMAFSSSFHADPAAGVACFASVNARNEAYRPRQTTAYAIRLMRAVRQGAPPPTAPDPLASYRFANAAAYAGRFVGPDGGDFTLTAGPGGLVLSAFGHAARTVPQRPDRLVTDHPRLARYGFDAVRRDGVVTGFWWGGTLFGRDSALVQPSVPDTISPLVGVYLNRDPWVGRVSVVARGDQLWADGLGRLVDRGGWWSAEKDPGGVERLRSDAVLGGQAQRLNVSGADLIRISV